MAVIAYPNVTVYAPLVLDYLTDAMHGMNVQLNSYLDLNTIVSGPNPNHGCSWPWDSFEPTQCFILFVWDDGLDYDLDGNAYYDDAPGDHVSSYHRTLKGAQMEAAYLEDAGIKPSRISIHYGWTQEINYNIPLRD